MSVADFKSFPLTPDLMSITDQHFSGVSGAHRILMQISADIHRLDAGGNDIGTRGAVVLLDGLDRTRRRLSVLPPTPRGRTPSPNRYRMLNDTPAARNSDSRANGRRPGDLWGLSEINLARNGIEDDGMLSAANYAMRDQWMRVLQMQANQITLGNVVDGVVERLNSSLLNTMSLSSNELDAGGVVRFFETLDAPKLQTLKLSTCSIPASCAPAISEFLRSPRSQRMGRLELNANQLTRVGVTKILDAIQLGNFTLERIGLSANNPAPARLAEEDQGAGYFGPDPIDNTDYDSDESLSRDDPRSMAYQIEVRVPALQKRNGKLTKRVRNAAARVIAPTRIIVHARPPTSIESATSKLEGTKVTDGASDAAVPEGAVADDGATASTTTAGFRLLDLPAEVQFLIARHASGDAYALSDAQWARLLKHAADRSTLLKLADRTSRAQARVTTIGHGAGPTVKRYKAREVRDEWLGDLKCEWWEIDNRRYWERLDQNAVLNYDQV